MKKVNSLQRVYLNHDIYLGLRHIKVAENPYLNHVRKLENYFMLRIEMKKDQDMLRIFSLAGITRAKNASYL